MDKVLIEFPITLYGNLIKYNKTLSKIRARIFYRYENRNGTYISDEFAEKLLSSLPYTPIKGIYSVSEEDYGDHGLRRDEGRIYGICPEDPHIAWEDHVDEDGITRTYACGDVLVFTALYKEAESIIDKSLSMELYGPALQYHEMISNGRRYIAFDDGCFLGLQVLGNEVEPCFEGASFYTKMRSDIDEIIYQLKIGGNQMNKINFKLSDSEKFNLIWNLINTEYTEEGNWTVTYGISAIYDEYALIVNYETGEYERVYYTKNDESNTIEINARKKCYVIDVTEEEMNTVNTLRKLNGETYAAISDTLLNAADNEVKISESYAKIEELNSSISSLETERENQDAKIGEYSQAITDLDANLTALKAENDALKEYKLGVERAQKASVINQYEGKLSEETLDTYRNSADNYELTELDMHLAYELKKVNFSIFNSGDEVGYVPKDSVPVSGIEAILNKYKNNK